jgi:hypothetical protein
MNNKEIILNCMEVNYKYMRLPAGELHNYKKLAALYQRLAGQLLQCAKAWLDDEPCPEHEPACDAFIWGVVEWAEAFGTSVGVDSVEWADVFIRPHEQFANYLLAGPHPEKLPFLGGAPADIILRLDVIWMERVVKLTAKWGLQQHLKDVLALREAQSLEKELRSPDSPAYRAYLDSDIAFFKALFPIFPFSKNLKSRLDEFIAAAGDGL